MSESQVVELADRKGTLLLNVRTTSEAGRRGQSFSQDYEEKGEADSEL
jgi:hypothetical protein